MDYQNKGPGASMLPNAGSIVVEDINKYNNMFVKLIIEITDGKPTIWVKLHYINEEQMLLTSRIGAQFSAFDNVDALKAFVTRVSPPPKPLLQYRLKGNQLMPVVTVDLPYQPMGEAAQHQE